MHEQLIPDITDNEIPSLVEKISILNLNEILSLKNRIESQLSKDILYLESQGIDMNSKLITNDGYPRQDIDDLVRVTLTRRDIIQRRNDLSMVINKSHKLLEEQLQKKNNSENVTTGDNKSMVEIPSAKLPPFALFEEVEPHGPIAKSGIKDGDKLVSLGKITIINGGLSKISKEVHPQKPIRIDIMRDDVQLKFEVIPNNQWGGAGLLGCKLTKL
ncbi:putative 26S proteasome regulatory subunit [Maudiozyma exigua]|uniref:26S proteasome regulatory subunit n=1 Tax=Maudiozyma exigua TaxID=34358 RepID=A0A9P6W2H2_MAUEX|nr:putative 26S proteasome regulatory subunit [Kazachstania exigua]